MLVWACRRAHDLTSESGPHKAPAETPFPQEIANPHVHPRNAMMLPSPRSGECRVIIERLNTGDHHSGRVSGGWLWLNTGC